MPEYCRVNIDFEPYVGPYPRSTGVFVKTSKLDPIAGELGKDWWPVGSQRQPYFETQILRLANSLNSRCVPVYIDWNGIVSNQLDKGCIGHSFASSNAFIESVARNFRGEITHIITRTVNAPNQ